MTSLIEQIATLQNYEEFAQLHWSMNKYMRPNSRTIADLDLAIRLSDQGRLRRDEDILAEDNALRLSERLLHVLLPRFRPGTLVRLEAIPQPWHP